MITVLRDRQVMSFTSAEILWSDVIAHTIMNATTGNSKF